MTALNLGVKPERDWVYLREPEDNKNRQTSASYWSGPVLADKEGRFQLAGLSAKARADITIVHPDYVHEALAITTERSWTPGTNNGRSRRLPLDSPMCSSLRGRLKGSLSMGTQAGQSRA